MDQYHHIVVRNVEPERDLDKSRIWYKTMIQGKNIEVLSPEMPYLSAIKALMYLATHTI